MTHRLSPASAVFETDRPLDPVRYCRMADVLKVFGKFPMFSGSTTLGGEQRILAEISRVKQSVDELHKIQLEQHRLIKALSHTAAGRGTVYLGNNRILTRISIPELFEGDPLLVVNADDVQLLPGLMRDGFYELNSTHYVVRRVRDAKLCIDVGANIGYYSVIMARESRNADILALEPNPITYKLLLTNLRINWFASHCQAICKGASDKVETLQLAYETSHLVNAQVVSGSAAPASHLISDAEFTTIDKLTEPYAHKCDFIKIDTEGYEPKVLEGMRKTLKSSPELSIMMEWSPSQIREVGLDPQNFCKRIIDHGFRCFIIAELGELREIPTNELISLPYQNIVLRQR